MRSDTAICGPRGPAHHSRQTIPPVWKCHAGHNPVNSHCWSRALTSRRASTLANASSVWAGIGGDGVLLDLMTDVLAADMNIALLRPVWRFVMNWCACLSATKSTQTILPEGRGPWAFQGPGHDCIAMMRDVLAQLLWTRVSPDLPHVALFARKCGCRMPGRSISTGSCSTSLTWRAEMPVAAVVGAAAAPVRVPISFRGTRPPRLNSNRPQLPIAEERRQYDQTRADYAPYREVGYGRRWSWPRCAALRLLVPMESLLLLMPVRAAPDTVADFPGYEWRLETKDSGCWSALLRLVDALRLAALMNCYPALWRRFGVERIRELMLIRLGGDVAIGHPSQVPRQRRAQQATQGITNARYERGEMRASCIPEHRSAIGNLAAQSRWGL